MSENSPSREPPRPTVNLAVPSWAKILMLSPSTMAISRMSYAARFGRSSFGNADLGLPEGSSFDTPPLRGSRQSRSPSKYA